MKQILRYVTFTVPLLILLLSSCGGSNPSRPPAYDAAIKEGQAAALELVNDGGASAVAIALVDTHHIIWSQGFGLADREAAQAPTDSTMFGIGSVSKMFAAIAVMKLVDRGVIDIDTPLVKYLPSFRMSSAEYKNVTIRRSSTTLPASRAPIIATPTSDLP